MLHSVSFERVVFLILNNLPMFSFLVVYSDYVGDSCSALISPHYQTDSNDMIGLNTLIKWFEFPLEAWQTIIKIR